MAGSFIFYFIAGSSPRVRGTPGLGGLEQGDNRFIPAGAGNTRCRPCPHACSTVHPRGRGEHDDGGRMTITRTGSSPRARGTPTWPGIAPLKSRFIPADAGNTGQEHSRPWPAPVHPRGCGEHSGVAGGAQAVAGSSPRVRGTHERENDMTEQERFIPAGAGNTALYARILLIPAVHPRGCGEHLPGSYSGRPENGSSPRVRGTQLGFARPLPAERFIPAGAGNTSPAPTSGV